MNQSFISEVRLSWSPVSRGFVACKPGTTAGRFIKGPIPLDWISQAACLPGKTLHVALVLRYLTGVQKTNTVKLGAKPLANFGVGRDAKYDALNRLKQAGLIAVRQTSGRTPLVTLLDYADGSEQSGRV